MNVERDPATRLLAAIEEPEPPRGLRGLALAGAAAAGARKPAVDAWRRLWESRPLRLAWAVAVALLLAANVIIRTGSPSHPRTAAPIAASKEHQNSRELQAIIELPRIRLEHAGIDVPEGRAAGPRTPEPKTPHHDTEDKS
jgi:hypothetical protein